MDLSIIIVSYNTKQLTLDCLASIYNSKVGFSYEIILVDNASSDGSAGAIAKKFPKVKLIKSKENLGFGGGNNLGVASARGEYLLLLNTDTIVNSEVLNKSFEVAKETKKLGGLSVAFKFADGSPQEVGGSFPDLPYLFAWQFYLNSMPVINRWFVPFHPPHKYFDRPLKLDWVAGAFLVMKRSVYNQIGGFDTNIFMYAEELEMFYRIRNLGLKTVYLDDVSIIHLKSKSSPKNYPQIMEIKGLKLIYQKYYPRWQWPLAWLIILAGSVLRLISCSIISSQRYRQEAYVTIIKNLF